MTLKPSLSLAVLVCLSLLLLLFSIGVVGAADDWVIDGTKVYIDDSRVYLSADPHTISSPRWVTFTLQSKQFTGDIDVVWGFSQPNVNPKKAEIYKPYWNNWTTEHQETFYYVTSFTPVENGCEYGYGYNTFHYSVDYSTPEYDEFGNISGWTPTTSIVCFDSYEWLDANNCTVTWHQQHSELIEWVDINGGNFEIIQKEHGGMNTWYLLKNVSVTAGETYILRAWVDLPISTEPIEGKYWWCLKPSSYTIQEAIDADVFYSLDPWYNAQWSHRKTITVTNPTAETLTNFPVLINVSYEAEMQNDFEDCVFTGSDATTVRPFEQDYYSDSSYALYWCNVSSIPASSFTTLYMYYGNDAAASQEDVEGTWDSHYVMVQHMNDDPDNAHITDSTSYSNDGTKKAANEPLEVSSPLGKAQQFDGIDDSLNCGNDGSFDVQNAITIESIIKPSALSAGGIVSKGTYYASTGSFCFVWNTPIAGRLSFSVKNNPFIYASIGTDLVYKNVAVVYDFPNSRAELYKDGNIIKNDLIAGSFISIPVTVLDVYLGRENYFFNGTISEVRISDVARSAAWIGATHEFVENQSTYVTWGSGEGPCPCEPTVTNTTGDFWVNFTFTPDDTGYPLTTDGYNVSWNNGTDSGWQNSTTPYINVTAEPHGYVNITVWTWNSTENATSCDNVTESIGPWANHAPVISGCEDVLYGNTGFNVTLDLNYTDQDSDTCTFSTDFEYGTLNATTGEFNWTIPADMLGVYHANFTVNDSYGGNDTCMVTIGNLDMLIYLQNLQLVEEQEMLGEIFFLIMFFAVGLVLFLTGLYTGNAVLTLISSLIFWIATILPAPILGDDYAYLALAAWGILFILALTSLLYTFYQWWVSYTSHTGWRKWDQYFEDTRR